jgi:hypothetical protein
MGFLRLAPASIVKEMICWYSGNWVLDLADRDAIVALEFPKMQIGAI